MKLADILYQLALADTKEQQLAALREAMKSAALTATQQGAISSRIAQLAVRPSQARELRPMPAAAVSCPELTVADPGPRPELPGAQWERVMDWIDGWRHEEQLAEAEMVLPGPMLLHGPTGTGKTTLIRYIAGLVKDRTVFVADGHAVMDSHLGGTGKTLDRITRSVAAGRGILVFEEVDGIASVRGLGGSSVSGEVDRITIALMRLMDLNKLPIIATTNRTDALDPALLRRFEYKVEFPEATAAQKAEVLRRILSAEPEPELLGIPLAQAVAEASRQKRRKFIASLKPELA